jgi:hypothetical protein
MDIYFWLREMAIEAQYKEGMDSERRRRLLEAADEIERLREALKDIDGQMRRADRYFLKESTLVALQQKDSE